MFFYDEEVEEEEAAPSYGDGGYIANSPSPTVRVVHVVDGEDDFINYQQALQLITIGLAIGMALTIGIVYFFRDSIYPDRPSLIPYPAPTKVVSTTLVPPTTVVLPSFVLPEGVRDDS